MIIQSGELQMGSTRRYARTTTGLAATTVETSGSSQLTAFQVQSGVSEGQQDFLGTLNYRMDRTDKASKNLDGSTEHVEQGTQLKLKTMHYLLELLFRRRFLGQQPAGMNQQLQDVFGQNASVGFSLYSYSSFAEEETTTFETTGKVVTSDGREIDFGVSLGMSRTFYEENEMYMANDMLTLCDPLVINMDVPTAQVTDQKFYFDLDADGTEDYISTLGQGSGFLALDKNGDGAINDGSELFGTSTGNGFYDLSQYDEDGNGWIDEGDEIFDRLRIWTVDAQGNSQLYTLKESDVGAICLCNVKTRFALNDDANRTNGVIQQSGIFLKESGQASTIQHVDFSM